MKSTRKLRRRRFLLLAPAVALLHAAPLHAGTVTFTPVAPEWDFSQDDKGNLSLISFTAGNVSVNVLGNVAVTANIRTAARRMPAPAPGERRS